MTMLADSLARAAGGRIAWLIRSHHERGCGDPLGGGWCGCACADHPCAGRAHECDACGGAGQHISVETLAGRRRLRHRLCPVCHTPAEVIAWQRAMHARGFPPLFGPERATLASLDVAVAAQVAGWLEPLTPPWLVLTGGVGAGKTHAACTAGWELVARDIPVQFVTATRLLDRVRATFDGEGESQGTAEAAYRLAPVLLLDDLGAEHATAWAQERLLSMLDDRLTGERPTILTTNVHPERAPADSRLWSRVFGTRHARIVLMTGRDRRRRP